MSSSSRCPRRTLDDITHQEGQCFTRNTTQRRTNNASRANVIPSPFNAQHTNAVVTPSPATNNNNRDTSSIRAGARNNSYSTRSTGSNPSSYDLPYRRNSTNSNFTDESNVAAIRICYCDQPVCPSMCPTRRNTGTHVSAHEYYCIDHPTIFCNQPGCSRRFHLDLYNRI